MYMYVALFSGFPAPEHEHSNHEWPSQFPCLDSGLGKPENVLHNCYIWDSKAWGKSYASTIGLRHVDTNLPMNLVNFLEQKP